MDARFPLLLRCHIDCNRVAFTVSVMCNISCCHTGCDCVAFTIRMMCNIFRCHTGYDRVVFATRLMCNISLRTCYTYTYIYTYRLVSVIHCHAWRYCAGSVIHCHAWRYCSGRCAGFPLSYTVYVVTQYSCKRLQHDALYYSFIVQCVAV